MEINDEQAKKSEGQNEDATAFDERVLQENENLEANDLNLYAELEPYMVDQTFARNEVSKIKPFRYNFSLLEKHSNLEAFHDAVHCALYEVSRRVEFGLACPCMPGYSKIKTRIIVNLGIWKESYRRDGGDSFSSAACFEPAKLIDHVKELSQMPLGGIDTLEFVIARSQLLALNCWNGYCHLPEFQFHGELLESDAEIPLSPEVKLGSEKAENTATTIGKEKLKSEEHSLHKRKYSSEDRRLQLKRALPPSGNNQLFKWVPGKWFSAEAFMQKQPSAVLGNSAFLDLHLSATATRTLLSQMVNLPHEQQSAAQKRHRLRRE
ncbi:hypothetical protein SADUNF_Sadunf16G0076800 [Salix dunnii]|uniref:Uncharacterized protein n=1 Tax=Salix dunnii TaxID=1413687 RepID=A0A835ML58_9ROSI|nr:hypothetical protein SADUNF_Sadunf16G0076800 [Salix dunnii]